MSNDFIIADKQTLQNIADVIRTRGGGDSSSFSLDDFSTLIEGIGGNDSALLENFNCQGYYVGRTGMTESAAEYNYVGLYTDVGFDTPNQAKIIIAVKEETALTVPSDPVAVSYDIVFAVRTPSEENLYYCAVFVNNDQWFCYTTGNPLSGLNRYWTLSDTIGTTSGLYNNPMRILILYNT